MNSNGHLKLEVRCLLKHGKVNAITGRELAKRLGFRDDRLIRQVIRELIAKGIPVASSVNPPYGYYIADSIEEAQEYMDGLRSRLVNDAYRRRDFKLASKGILNPHQMVMLLR